MQSSVGAADHVHQFRDLAALVGLVARRDRVLDAMGDMVAQDFLLDPAQRRPRRRDLRDDVDAVAVVLHHAGEAANLALYPVQPFQDGSLDLLAHAPNIPPQGIWFKVPGAFRWRWQITNTWWT